MKDIEIARMAKLEKIINVAKKIGIEEDEIECYGKYKAKIEFEKIKGKQEGKLILVTAISPTPLGEGKTTVSIAIADALDSIGEKTVITLREPSLGPVFGIKGGATGGGLVQVVPMEDINLHFTGDIHAITSANNLLSSLIDNHMYFGNELGFDTVVFKRCIDLNDRQLRKIETGLSGEKKIVKRTDSFDITAASEIMSILCLAQDKKDLIKRLGNIICGYTVDNKPIYARKLEAEGAMAVLLKDAIKPNLVQTLANVPTIMHGGPFANIAHGCNSVIATKTALKLADYVVTEAGFGADLGAEKFLDIKCKNNDLNPSVIVLVATVKALKYHGENDLEEGMDNLYRHIDNLKNKFNKNVIVALNKYADDSLEDIEYIKKCVNTEGVQFSLVEGYTKGAEGAKDIANIIVKEAKKDIRPINFAYDLIDNIDFKIKKVVIKIYGAENVHFANGVQEKIEMIQNMGYKDLPICIAKNQYSFSDNPKNLLLKEPFTITVSDVCLKAGAGFIVVYVGNIMTMPGLSEHPSAEKIGFDKNGLIKGIF